MYIKSRVPPGEYHFHALPAQEPPPSEEAKDFDPEEIAECALIPGGQGGARFCLGASRPHVSDDNPFSGSQFKTMKYRPDFPRRFGGIEDVRLF